jgi:putative two-component system response regulator
MDVSPKFTVMIIDDVKTNIDILVETLRPDHEISVAMDGKAALEAIAEDKPDLILLDVMMPEMDGYEVCKRLKGGESTRNIPVIFITAMTEERDEAKGLALGGGG